MGSQRRGTRGFHGGCGGGGGAAKEDGRGLVGDGEWLSSCKSGEGRPSQAERAAVVGVSSCQVMSGVDGSFHEAAPLLAPADRVLVVQLGCSAPHAPLSFSLSTLSEKTNQNNRDTESSTAVDGGGSGGWMCRATGNKRQEWKRG